MQMVPESCGILEEIPQQLANLPALHVPVFRELALVGNAIVQPLAMFSQSVPVWNRHECRCLLHPMDERVWVYAITRITLRTRSTYTSTSKVIRGLSEYLELRLSSTSRTASREFKTMVGVRKTLK